MTTSATKENRKRDNPPEIFYWFLRWFAYTLSILVATGFIIYAFFNIFQPIVTSSFPDGLVTLDSLVIAAISFLMPSMITAMGLDTVMEEANKLRMIGTPNAESDSQLTSLMIGGVMLRILVPIFVMFPFFVSAVIALMALLTLTSIGMLFGELALWLTLGWFFAVLVLFLKVALVVRNQYLIGFHKRHPT